MIGTNGPQLGESVLHSWMPLDDAAVGQQVGEEFALVTGEFGRFGASKVFERAIEAPEAEEAVDEPVRRADGVAGERDVLVHHDDSGVAPGKGGKHRCGAGDIGVDHARERSIVVRTHVEDGRAVTEEDQLVACKTPGDRHGLRCRSEAVPLGTDGEAHRVGGADYSPDRRRGDGPAGVTPTRS
ncbi:MAG TPA: hypothetical protein VG346_11960 [Acidimicrobiales bacterium]|nr:hypothetical protein [Acidimicrobiales bacterium]